MRMKALWTMVIAFLVMGVAMAQAAPGNPLGGLAQLKEGRTMRASSCDPNWANGNGDARPILPGETLTICELEGPGVINHFWNTIAAQERGYSRLLILRMYWDGEESPSVECPIGDFFAMGHGVDHPVQSQVVTVTSEGRARNCYWPMPFGKSARLTVTNDGDKPITAFFYYVDWQKLDRLPKDTAYFHASYRQEFPTMMGQNYLIADIEGRGHYVGTVLSIYQLTASWWGEGDDFWFIDGEAEPRLRGTGSEDYFCDAWGFRELNTPFYGVPKMEGYDAFDKTTAYRWHITDPVCFDRSLRLEIEHKGVTFDEDGAVKSGFEERSDYFSSAAFWYQIEPHKPHPAPPAAYDRLYVDWRGMIEAEASLDAVTATSGSVVLQDGGWSGGSQLFWMADKADQSIEIPIEIAEDGEHLLLLVMTHSWDYGIYQPELDGKPLGAPIDMYSNTVTFHEHVLPLGNLTAGSHVLRFVNKGSGDKSKGYFFGLDGFLVAPAKKGE